MYTNAKRSKERELKYILNFDFCFICGSVTTSNAISLILRFSVYEWECVNASAFARAMCNMYKFILSCSLCAFITTNMSVRFVCVIAAIPISFSMCLRIFSFEFIFHIYRLHMHMWRVLLSISHSFSFSLQCVHICTFFLRYSTHFANTCWNSFILKFFRSQMCLSESLFSVIKLWLYEAIKREYVVW